MKKNYIKVIILFFTIYLYSLVGFAQTNNNPINENTSFVNIEYNALIYPNPVTDNRFYVKSDKLIKKVEVINVIGQIVKTINNETNIPYNIFVQFNDIDPGMYMVRITFKENKKIIKKLLIK